MSGWGFRLEAGTRHKDQQSLPHLRLRSKATSEMTEQLVEIPDIEKVVPVTEYADDR